MPPVNHSPQSEYHGLSYVPLDSSYGMSISPPYSSLPLSLPSHQWPSVIAAQSHHYQPDSSLPHVPLPALSQVAPINTGRKGSIGGATPRRTLTDEDRRQMCLYHEEHKTAKQTDIGGKSCIHSTFYFPRMSSDFCCVLQLYLVWKEGTVEIWHMMRRWTNEMKKKKKHGIKGSAPKGKVSKCRRWESFSH